MKKWECLVCGWIYDEAVGDVESGLAPGTRWEDVPDDWVCPDCGAGKDDFAMVAMTAQDDLPHHDSGSPLSAAPVIILGTGMAGYGLAKEFRKLDSDTPLVIITADDGRAYPKPMLSTGFTRNSAAKDLVQSDAGSMARSLNASVWTMTSVAAIDTAAQQITLGACATRIAYRKLILALGADTITPPLQGDALDSVYSVNDLMDYADFRQAIENNGVKKVCIIGGGLIGCEFANDLLNGGIAVEVVDPLGYCLPTLLPEPAGQAVQRGLELIGAQFHFGALVEAVDHGEQGLAVRLNNGKTLQADLVLSAVGVRARTALAKQSGLAVNRGIVTNRLLETSAANVYALGDCAEVDGHALVYVAPLMAGARALAKTLVGEPTPVSYPAMPVGVKTPACPVVVSPPPREAAGQWHCEQQGNHVRAEFRSPDGQLLGFALTGDATADKAALQKQLPPIMA